MNRERLRVEVEDWLMVLAWGAGKLLVPTLANWWEPYEAWEHRQRFRYQARRLEQYGWAQRVKENGQPWLQLTEQGRLTALGGRDPVPQWDRPWDGRWRMFVFDLPVGQTAVRQRLLRWLRQQRFGYLQDSVWIRPDPVDEMAEALRPFQDDVESFTFLEALPVGGQAPQALVRGAWNFDQINERYAAYLQFVKRRPKMPLRGRAARPVVLAWGQQERRLWEQAFPLDPLLPRLLWPAGYLGERAWRERNQTLAALVQQMISLAT
jgi:DNA-binding transcriptional regulator PaaX